MRCGMMLVKQLTFNQKYFLACHVLALLTFLLIFYSNFEKDIESYCPRRHLHFQTEEDLIVLLWTWPFGDYFPLNQCPKPLNGPWCFYTTNHSWYPRAHAVIFHHRDVCSSEIKMPQMPRPEGQHWVWFNMESPSHTPNLSLFNNLMNLTMSYRSDSDIFTPYGWLEKNEAQNFTIPEKSKLVAWAISNWNSTSKRVEYYNELKDHIDIDVYGQEHMRLHDYNLNAVLSRYKFYLAFENSIHSDYITEKLWRNALVSGTVPIVMGPPRENYEKFIPSHSFIHVNDFLSAKDLADYLLELDKDPFKYKQYFKWRLRLQPVGEWGWETHYCKACLALHEARPYRTIQSLSKWYT
ncbi:4-galactosyl-N-acetylglucosaminide 3-alpha-L-fucosyltransferase FUT6-like isoform X2 [Dendropsophus ebraccatus]|uniref:4-galactosyl-N-acetylglucosaminide 3-alpha-L-fucosyltransferase FUT6-like isoform X2 n=1 Tax=Dendropsophus ebraccatus TaxID=150705 RepID=UPI003831054D